MIFFTLTAVKCYHIDKMIDLNKVFINVIVMINWVLFTFILYNLRNMNKLIIHEYTRIKYCILKRFSSSFK